MKLLAGGLSHSPIEPAGLIEDRDEVAEMRAASCHIEVAVRVYELLERIQKVETPVRGGGTRNSLPRDVHIHRRGVRKYGPIQCIWMTAATRHRRDPEWSVLKRSSELEFVCCVAFGQDAVGSDQRQSFGAGPAHPRADVETVTRCQVEHGARPASIHAQREPRPIGDKRAARADGDLEPGHRK